MSAAGLAVTAPDRAGATRNLQFISAALSAILIAYTLLTQDGSDVAPFAISGALLVLFAWYAIVPLGRLRINLPAACLLGMACYAALRTSLFSQTLTYAGWTRVLFWLSAAAITLIASGVFKSERIASQFRFLLVVFGGIVAVLDLLEQASHTSSYFWLMKSHYAAVYGTFAYWNNFAEFMELVLPVTLWMGVAGRRFRFEYILLASIEIGAVAASGSRAGAALALCEVMCILILAHIKKRNRKRRSVGNIAAVAALCAIFVASAGFGTLAAKLERPNQIAVRGAIDRSSMAMIRQKPLAGWGLGSYVPVYRMFATYDDGSWVNQAHNDWLEWAAEGGIPFAAVMLAVFLWSLQPAVLSGWGVGAIALCLHAAVDYPFARLGVCGWYFALLGMLAAAAPSVGKTDTP